MRGYDLSFSEKDAIKSALRSDKYPRSESGLILPPLLSMVSFRKLLMRLRMDITSCDESTLPTEAADAAPASGFLGIRSTSITSSLRLLFLEGLSSASITSLTISASSVALRKVRSSCAGAPTKSPRSMIYEARAASYNLRHSVHRQSARRKRGRQRKSMAPGLRAKLVLRGRVHTEFFPGRGMLDLLSSQMLYCS